MFLEETGETKKYTTTDFCFKGEKGKSLTDKYHRSEGHKAYSDHYCDGYLTLQRGLCREELCQYALPVPLRPQLLPQQGMPVWGPWPPGAPSCGQPLWVHGHSPVFVFALPTTWQCTFISVNAMDLNVAILGSFCNLSLPMMS